MFRLTRISLAMFLVPAATVAVLGGTVAKAADPVACYAATTVNINS